MLLSSVLLPSIVCPYMHKKTIQFLKLSRVLKTMNDKDPKRNISPEKSVQSEVRSDNEIKQIITELQSTGK